MRRDFSGLARDTFDLIVIGGGIVGTGIARDAALRGLHTLLVEHLDFAINEFREMKMQPSLERALSHKEILGA